MAKVSMIEREKRRQKSVEKYATRRAEIKAVIRNPNSTDEERWDAQKALQRQPRDASPVRLRNRCGITGRPHGYYRKFGLSRIKVRELAMNGEIPGISKASW